MQMYNLQIQLKTLNLPPLLETLSVWSEALLELNSSFSWIPGDNKVSNYIMCIYFYIRLHYMYTQSQTYLFR